MSDEKKVFCHTDKHGRPEHNHLCHDGVGCGEGCGEKNPVAPTGKDPGSKPGGCVGCSPEHSHGHPHSCGSAAHHAHALTCGEGGEIPDRVEYNIVRFAYLLKGEGMRIGSSEVIDALNALQVIPLGEREKVKAALKATMVKKSADRETFDRVFDHFFTGPEIKEEFRQQRREKIELFQQKMEEAEGVFTFRGEQLELSEKEKTVYSCMPEKEKKRLQDFLQMNESRDTLHPEYRPFLESLVKGRLNFWYSQLHREVSEEADQQDMGDEDLNAIRDAAGGEGKGGRSILTEDMRHIARKDLPQATALIRRMTRLLVTRISRRYRISKNRRVLDLRSTIRHSIQYGGAPFKLKYRSRRVKKPRLLLICDVSGSMIRYTAFVLQFIYGLNAAVQHIESFTFSEDLERVTSHFQEGGDFDRIMSSLVKESSQWGGGTSLHRALRTLGDRHAEDLTSNTIVIIVSDTRTVRHQDAQKEMGKLKEQVKEVVWLNTLPQEMWNQYSTVQAFKKVTSMFPCNTLADLEQVMSKKFLSA